jgi:hypothetical protein
MQNNFLSVQRDSERKKQLTFPHLHLLHPPKLASSEGENFLSLHSPLLSHLSFHVLEPTEDKMLSSTEFFLYCGGRHHTLVACRRLDFMAL